MAEEHISPKSLINSSRIKLSECFKYMRENPISNDEINKIRSYENRINVYVEEWTKINKKLNIENKSFIPQIRFINVGIIDICEKAYKISNDSKELFEAIKICIELGLSIPEWCAKSFIKSVEYVEDYKIISWDDAFGRPYPKGTNISSLRNKYNNSLRVYMYVRDIKEKEPDKPIDDNLFDEIGRELGIGGKTVVKEMYYRIKKNAGDFIEELITHHKK